ncbi:hypothetical protein TSMG0166 [Halocynthia phage JM-2012]|uniref:DnaB-like replicative helicase n=1 Tax=Halocynthia phage JM-2012 TaxID=1173297 RepID=UPI00025C6988|nr:DnaB-like replicative helicase [Halocynthia phage JM-2012]AFI55449.1 hypothetical protein TSMG0166 [Halocynthia phage JM-2012]
MKERIVLINILLALINQSYGSNKNQTLMSTIDEALPLIRTPSITSGGNDEASLLISLKELILELKQIGTKDPYDVRHVMARLRIMGIYFKDVVNLLEDNLNSMETKSEELANRDYYSYHSQVNNFVREARFQKVMQEYSFKLREDPDLLKDRESFVRKLNEELTPYVSAGSGFKYTDIPGIQSATDVGDSEELERIYEETQDLYSDLGVLKFDLQGWNDLFGPSKGILRGEFGEIQALSGMGKSETMRKMLTGIAVSNDPHMLNPDKKPLIVYLTFEDTQREVYEKMFVQLYREQYDTLTEINDLSTNEIVKYVQERLQSKGYHFKVIYGEKYASSPYDVVNLLEALQQDGYEIHAFGLDYMLLLNMNNVPGMMDTYKVKNGYGIIGAYTKSRGITCITAAQIDDSAKYLVTESEEFARDAVNRNMSAGSKYIIHELDFRLFAHVEEAGDGYFHQLAKGKHRLGKGTPSRDKYAVYKMHSVNGTPGGFIKSDLDGKSQVRNDTGGNLRADGGGLSF